MADKNRKTNESNPFSFKSFVTKSNTALNGSNIKTEDKKDPSKTSTEHSDAKSGNPFRFTSFVQEKTVKKQDGVVDEDRPLRIHENHFENNLSGNNMLGTTANYVSDILPDFSDDDKIELTTHSHALSREKQSDIKLNPSSNDDGDIFDSDSDFSDDGERKPSLHDKKQSYHGKTPHISLTEVKELSDSDDDFLPSSKSYKPPKLLHDLLDTDSTTTVILEDLNGLTKPELIRKIEQLREENRTMVSSVKYAEEKGRKNLLRITELETELISVKKKEAEETAALEKIIQQVESNLESSKERSLLAETTVKDLKLEVKRLQGSVSKLEQENKELKSKGVKLSQDATGEQLQYVSEQLNTAAVNAEQSLKQLMGGVETLKLMSKTLVSLDKFQEIPSDYNQ